jgi:RHS repeat-associated protein
MKWQRFFLIVFLLPTLMYALNQEECANIFYKILPEWNRHNELIQQFQKKPYTQEGLQLLKESLACCQRAVKHCDTILNDIISKKKDDRKKQWRVDLKSRCEKEKQGLNTEINQLQIDIGRVEANISATALYNISLEKATDAGNKDRSCERGFNNVDKIVSVLNETAKLYKEASSLANQALSLINPYPQEEDKAALKRQAANYQELAEKYKNEAVEWPSNAANNRAACKEKIAEIKTDCGLLTEKGLKRSCYDLQKHALFLLEQLLDGNTSEEASALKQEQAQLQEFVAAFEKEADDNRLTDVKPVFSKEEFEAREKERRELFFKSDFLLNPDLYLPETVKNEPLPRIVPLDGQTGKKEGDFSLYTDQFYRFLIQSQLAEPELTIKVLENGQEVHTAKIALPFKNTDSWEDYLKNGMIFIPDTKLKSDFGLDLRLSFAADPHNKFSLIVSQKSTDLRYQFAISLGEESAHYACQFSAPPPWQLETLRKPASAQPNKPINSNSLPSIDVTLKEGEQRLVTSLESMVYPVLDRLVEELKKDPLALASFVQNEIALVDAFLHQENGVIHPVSVYRNPCTTFLEKQGSAWEQCQLLVYLLRKAGFKAVYALGDSCSLPKDFVERMLLTKLPEDKQEALLKYPWVLFFDSKEWISLFPWMKDIQVHEGHDLYSFLPEKYASADRWILQYLKGDQEILKHIGPEGDDTAGVLFVRFVEENLRKQGLHLSDVGIHRTWAKKQYFCWGDFPHPSIQSQPQIYNSLDAIPQIYAWMKIDINSRQNPKKSISRTFPVPFFNSGASFIRFDTNGNNQTLFAQLAGKDLPAVQLDSSDRVIDVSIQVEFLLGNRSLAQKQTFSIEKGASAALCSHFGGDNPKVTSQYFEQFKVQKDEKKKLLSLLAFVGASYFEKCSRSTNVLAALHKVNPTSPFAFGLAKLSPDLSKGPFRGEEDLVLPQVDMFRFHAGPSELSTPSAWHQEQHTARTGFEALSLIDGSSNEHQILREIFKDDYAVSTVKLLQLAHLEQQKQGLEGEGFLTLTPASFEAANKNPESAQSQYFSNLQDFNLFDLKTVSPWQWNMLQTLMDPNQPWSSWTYAYMTPGLVSSLDGTRKEMGTIIISPHAWYALISINDIVTNGGLGTPLPNYYLSPWAIRNWDLVPTSSSYTNSYALQVPAQTNFSNLPAHPVATIEKSIPGKRDWISDVRAGFRDSWNFVADPIDIVSGAFYIDEIDLVLPGPFPLTIRRNYNSQNPLIGDLGCGWKLSVNPFLVDQDGKRFAAELDGTVIVYSYNRQTDRWEVFPEENPELSNFNQQGIGSSASPFHSYIENDVLYGADGSKRSYKDGLLQQWIDVRGNTLSFSYKNDRLSRIESSNGDFCGVHYNHEDNISEIYAKDGRRISYGYDSQGDLIKVTLPNTAEISYTYDQNHRVIRETMPHGRVLENVYTDKGQVKEQRSPMGYNQQMVRTATFEYADGKTIVTDAEGGKTTYQIHDKKIYKITDPLGFTTTQAWFIDRESWFNPETEEVAEWNQKGGAVRSLKSTTDKRGLTTSYLYDAQGNLEIITLEGEDLTGSRDSKVQRKLAYNERNLCIEEEVHGQKILTTYDSTFPYLPKRIEKYSESTLVSYIDFDYNSLGQLEKEDRSGSITIWHYNDRGFPHEKIQMTGTEDPDIVTTYTYNPQGQCIEITSVDGTLESDYDLVGNQTETKVFSPSGEMLSATYIGYDLNNAPIWKQTANSENIVYFDYHASGLIKAKRQSLAPSRSIAYTLYEYNSSGYLTEETDPRGYVTYRDYDPLGRIKAETKEGHTTLFSYEAGGLVETITSPSGGQLTRHYTTSGLLKEEIYPDGTKNTIVYDFFGRPILETKNDIVWEIKYDDAHHRVIRTHLATKISEISEFDPRGNLIKFTDAAGYALEKTYDGLNRLKTEISPSGKSTSWSYQDNLIVCSLPSGETTTTQYAGGRAIKSETSDSRGTLIAVSEFHVDLEHDKEEVIEGDERTVTWRNALGLLVRVEKGEITARHEYDACGNCITSIDGDGRVTRQEFDALGRLTQKHLPDGTVLEFVYDSDSNLAEYHLPNGNVWKASYDSMHRKKSEELISSRGSSERWTFSYEDGYLREATDPMQRTHTYLYDHYGRVFQDSVEGGKRTYTYEPRGFLRAASQTTDIASSWLSSWVYGSQSENSLVERSYDADGNLALESVYLNSNLIQQTRQKWTANSRSLQIGNHVRDFFYQNNQLVQVATQAIGVSFSYDLSGALKGKNSRLSSTTIDYNSAGLPEAVVTSLPEGFYQEQLNWYPSGKIYTYTAPGRNQSFSYNQRGHLISTGLEKYDFDFGSAGVGVRTAAPGWHVPQNGLDDFGRILASVFEKTSLSIGYNAMGEVITHGQKQLSWDPWGRLTKVIDPSYLWEASYDALGRRLQTRYTKSGEQTLITNSLYDPEEEFQEIGVQIGRKTFWKIYGPDACDAISDETGSSVTFLHNALRQLTGIVSPQGTLYSEKPSSFYGPLEINPSVSSDLVSYAQSLNWHSKAQDPTGFIWMGGRYYDSRSGQFLSQDPVSYPMCLDLYAYANGDPVNYFDPDGRFASPVYQSVKPVVIGALQPFNGLNQAIQGFNAIPAYLANHDLTRSSSFQTGSFDLPCGAIGFINGINNQQTQSIASAQQLSQYAGGAKVYGIYNATNWDSIQWVSTAIDVLECGLGHMRMHTPPVQLLKNQWNHFIATHGPDEKFLQISHSGGALQVYNALLTSPKSVQQRIISLTLAPAAIIPEELCFRSYNYMSRRDIVTRLDVIGKIKYGNQLQVLEPHPNANFWDHEFLSPTFAPKIRRHINDYIENYEGKK